MDKNNSSEANSYLANLDQINKRRRTEAAERKKQQEIENKNKVNSNSNNKKFYRNSKNENNKRERSSGNSSDEGVNQSKQENSNKAGNGNSEDHMQEDKNESVIGDDRPLFSMLNKKYYVIATPAENVAGDRPGLKEIYIKNRIGGLKEFVTTTIKSVNKIKYLRASFTDKKVAAKVCKIEFNIRDDIENGYLNFNPRIRFQE